MSIIKILLAGFMAAFLAWFFNRLLLALRTREVAAILGPVVEETLKTGLALAMGIPLPGVHSVFGLAEGFWELEGRPPGALPARGYWRARLGPALAAVGGHTFFGWLALLAYNRTGQPGLAWGLGLLAHLAWNRGILSLHASACRRSKT